MVAHPVLAEAYRRTRGPVAYLDESYELGLEGRRRFYVFTAVVVHRRNDIEPLQKGLRERAETDYWHTTEALQDESGRRRARELLRYLADGDELCVIAFHAPVLDNDPDGEQTRLACYRDLVGRLASGVDGRCDPVGLVVLEQRSPQRHANLDRKNHSTLIKEGLIPPAMRQVLVSPRQERLLWLPDLVCSAFRRTVTHHDGSYFALVEDQTYVIKLPTA